MLTSGGEPLQLTNDEGDKHVDAFSSDGREVYYKKQFGQDEIWAVPTLGGNPRRIATAASLVPSIDGEFIYYTKSDTPGIFRARKSGANEQLVYESKGASHFPILMFPGGNDLLVAGVEVGDSPNISFSKINLATRQTVELGEVSGYRSGYCAWAEPGVSVLLSRTVNGLTNLWEYNLRDRSLTQMTFGTGSDFSPMPDPVGKGIYYVSGRSSGLLTAYHVHSKEFKDILSDDASQPIVSRDGKRVMYITLAPEKQELWISDIDGGNRIKIAGGGEETGTGTWSHDGSHLSFVETEGNTGMKLYIIGTDGSGRRQLPPIGDLPWNSVWSPDQKSVYNRR
jgi:Tol biopolymer transport system component